jgi:pimeloyl-ACP methyl ester carboxylesterase
MVKLLFLPGAGASADFWRPAAQGVLPERARHFFSWPGLGNEPPRPEARGVDDLVAMVLAEMAEPVDLIAQSMGGLVAIKAALAAPDKVRRMVLTATSGGVPVGDLGGANWRVNYRRDFPNAAPWITEIREDLSSQLGTILAPTLLLWGDKDAISPLTVGNRLKDGLPKATLVVVQGGDHALAQTHAAEIAPLITGHLR